MSVSLRLPVQDEQVIRAYAETHNISISEFARKAMIEKIENEMDIKAWRAAMKEYQKNPVSYSHEEMGKRLGFK